MLEHPGRRHLRCLRVAGGRPHQPQLALQPPLAPPRVQVAGPRDRQQVPRRRLVGLALREPVDDRDPGVLREVPGLLAVPAAQPQEVAEHHR